MINSFFFVVQVFWPVATPCEGEVWHPRWQPSLGKKKKITPSGFGRCDCGKEVHLGLASRCRGSSVGACVCAHAPSTSRDNEKLFEEIYELFPLTSAIMTTT